MPLPKDDAEARAFQLGKSLLVFARLCLMFISYAHILCSYLMLISHVHMFIISLYIYTAAAAAARRNSLESELRPKNVVDIDLSCKSVAAKKEDEMKRTLSRIKSIKERVDMYTTGEDEKIDIDKLKNEELQDVIDNPTLNEREKTDKMKEIQAKYGMMKMQIEMDKVQKAVETSKKKQVRTTKTRAERELAPTKGKRSSIDLSAKVAAMKKTQELDAVRRQSSTIKDRRNLLKEAQSKKKSEEETVKSHLVVTEDEHAKRRRASLMKIMRRKSLSKVDKQVKMEEVKQRYANTNNPDEQAAVENERRAETKAILNNRRLSSEERKQQLN